MSTYSDADDKQEVSLKTGGQTKEHVSDEDIEHKDAEDNQEKVLLKKGSKHKHGKRWNKKYGGSCQLYQRSLLLQWIKRNGKK